MKTENTLENKVKFLGQYLNSADVTVEFDTDNREFNYTKRLRYYNIGCIESGWQGFVGGYTPKIKKAYLELTPLSEITDEDAIELIKLQFSQLPKGFKVLKFDRSYKDIPSFTYSFMSDSYGKGVSEIALLDGSKDFYGKLSIKQYKSAIGKGYYVGDETEIEYGWVKLKE